MRSLFLALALVCAPAAQAAAVLTITPTPVNVFTGQSFQVGVQLSGLPDIVAFQFDVLFPEFLTLDGVTESGFFAANGVTFSPGTTGTGTVTGIFDALIGPGPIPDPDTLVLLDFTANTEGAGVISLANILLLDSDFNEAELSEPGAAGVSVTLAPIADVPEPSSTLLLAAALGALALKRRY